MPSSASKASARSCAMSSPGVRMRATLPPSGGVPTSVRVVRTPLRAARASSETWSAIQSMAARRMVGSVPKRIEMSRFSASFAISDRAVLLGFDGGAQRLQQIRGGVPRQAVERGPASVGIGVAQLERHKRRGDQATDARIRLELGHRGARLGADWRAILDRSAACSRRCRVRRRRTARPRPARRRPCRTTPPGRPASPAGRRRRGRRAPAGSSGGRAWRCRRHGSGAGSGTGPGCRVRRGDLRAGRGGKDEADEKEGDEAHAGLSARRGGGFGPGVIHRARLRGPPAARDPRIKPRG